MRRWFQWRVELPAGSSRALSKSGQARALSDSSGLLCGCQAAILTTPQCAVGAVIRRGDSVDSPAAAD